MKRPDDDVLLRDMADYARRAVTAATGKTRQALDSDPVLAAALERFIEIIGEAASKLHVFRGSGCDRGSWTRVGIENIP